MDGPNPSKMNIKVLIPATTSHFTNTGSFLNWKREKINAEKKEIHGFLATIIRKLGNKVKNKVIITFMYFLSQIILLLINF